MIKLRWPAAGTRAHRARCGMLLDRWLLMAAGNDHQHPPGLTQLSAAATAQVSTGCGNPLLRRIAVTDLQALRLAQHESGVS